METAKRRMTIEVKDEMLAADLKNGNVQALGEIYMRYGVAVRGALRRFVPEMGQADADELCQEVFLTLNDTIGRYEEQQKLKAWIFGIALRKARSWRRNTWLRRKILNRRSEESVHLNMGTGDTPARTLELKQEVEAALGQLSDKQRDVVLLYSLEGFTCEEAADILGVDIHVVWSRLHRARQAVSKTLDIPAAERVVQGEL